MAKKEVTKKEPAKVVDNIAEHFRSKTRKKISKKDALKIVTEKAKTVTEEDVMKVLDKADDIEKKCKSEGPLGRFITDVKTMVEMVKDYWNRKYRKIPYFSIAAVVATLLYLLNPFDIIPDVLPVMGLLDDATVMAACLLMVEQDLHNYREWKVIQK